MFLNAFFNLRWLVFSTAFPIVALAQQIPTPAPAPSWPAEVREVTFKSTADGSQQPGLFYAPPGVEPVPLLVNLHTWSCNYRSPEPAYALWCLKKGWAFVRPDFRGANSTPQACGSDLAVQDIVDAVRYAQAHANIDPDRIYLVGVSGGGHAALLLAGRHPEIWAGVSAWCPIEDLTAWHARHTADGKPDKYARGMEAACGGPPGTSEAVDQEYRKRSPSAWLAQATGLPLDINAGIRDGHRGSVPVSHSLNAYNLVAAGKDALSAELISEMTAQPKVRESERWSGKDPLYQRGEVLFRKISDSARVTLFNGAHQIFPEAALAWLAEQRKGKRAVWEISARPDSDIIAITSQSGK